MVEFDFARPLSAMKYGLLIIMAAIPAIIILAIVGVIFGSIIADVFTSGDFESGMIILMVSYIVMIVAAMVCGIQIITFGLNAAFKDGMAEYEPMGYLGTWKKAFSIFLELIYMLVAIITLLVVGIALLDSSASLGVLIMVVAGIMYILMYAGMIPYICRRVLEGDGNTQKGDGNTQDPLGGLYPPS